MPPSDDQQIESEHSAGAARAERLSRGAETRRGTHQLLFLPPLRPAAAFCAFVPP